MNARALSKSGAFDISSDDDDPETQAEDAEDEDMRRSLFFQQTMAGGGTWEIFDANDCRKRKFGEFLES